MAERDDRSVRREFCVNCGRLVLPMITQRRRFTIFKEEPIEMYEFHAECPNGCGCEFITSETFNVGLYYLQDEYLRRTGKLPPSKTGDYETEDDDGINSTLE